MHKLPPTLLYMIFVMKTVPLKKSKLFHIVNPKQVFVKNSLFQ